MYLYINRMPGGVIAGDSGFCCTCDVNCSSATNSLSLLIEISSISTITRELAVNLRGEQPTLPSEYCPVRRILDGRLGGEYTTQSSRIRSQALHVKSELKSSDD